MARSYRYICLSASRDIPSIETEQFLDQKIENESLQKSLQRLADEDGSNYLENFK